jgi:hypothetical protein
MAHAIGFMLAAKAVIESSDGYTDELQLAAHGK